MNYHFPNPIVSTSESVIKITIKKNVQQSDRYHILGHTISMLQCINHLLLIITIVIFVDILTGEHS